MEQLHSHGEQVYLKGMVILAKTNYHVSKGTQQGGAKTLKEIIFINILMKL